MCLEQLCYIDVDSITCTHYCILFMMDLVFSATCAAMSLSEGNHCNITRIQSRTILHNVCISDRVLFFFLQWFHLKIIVYCFKNGNLLGTVLPLHLSPSIGNTVTIKHTQDGLSLRLLSFIHISITKVYILGFFFYRPAVY